jgi:hypothetical protein
MSPPAPYSLARARAREYGVHDFDGAVQRRLALNMGMDTTLLRFRTG